VVYIVDRAQYLYFVDAQTGQMLRASLSLGGLGAAGVAIARSTAGDMMLFVPGGGGDQPSPTPGVMVAFSLPTTHPYSTATSSSSSGTSGGSGTGALQVPVIIALGAVVVVLAAYIVVRKRGRKP
jgi:hypothetical protein